MDSQMDFFVFSFFSTPVIEQKLPLCAWGVTVL